MTLNRTQDGRFGKSVCDVVKARTVVVRNQEIKKTEVVKTGFFGRPEMTEKREVVAREVPVCQFSWTCAGYARKPKSDDERWIESQEIARRLAEGEYIEQKKDLYFDELGMAVDQYLFWSIRKGEAFDNGWYIIPKNVQPWEKYFRLSNGFGIALPFPIGSSSY
mgnify:CR=1 FL=1